MQRYIFTNRKGITLIEMAIVLVVIGILIGVTLKVRNTIFVSDVTSEVARVASLVDSYAEMVALSGGRFAYDAAGVITVASIRSSSKLTEESFKGALTTPTGAAYSYSYARCAIGAGGFVDINIAGTRVCITTVTTPPFDVAANAVNGGAFGNATVYCMYENKLDDRSGTSGSMRLSGAVAGMNFDDCMNVQGLNARYFLLLPEL